MNISQEYMLQAVPHRNRAMSVEELEGGILVTIPMRRPWWSRGPMRLVFNISKNRRIQLDTIGGYVLSLFDGRRTVEKVINKLMRRHKLSFQEARVSVYQFVRMLMQRGVIVVEVPENVPLAH